jgi:hypothetical protein
MRPVACVLLWVAGFAGLILFASFDVTNDGQQYTLRVGHPTPWYSYERDVHGFRSETDPFTLGGAAGILALVAFSSAWQLTGRSPPTERTP